MTPPLQDDVESKSIPLLPPVEFDIVVEEVKEEKAPLMVRLVEDFSLQSESDEDEDEVVEIKSEMMMAAPPPADIKESSNNIEKVEVKKEVAEEEEEKVLVSNEEELLVDVKSKVDFLDTLCLQSVSSLRSTDLGAKEALASRRTLNQYHQVGFSNIFKHFLLKPHLN